VRAAAITARSDRIQRHIDQSEISTASVVAALRRADAARGRLISALLRSAAAHERAAEVLQTSLAIRPELAQQVRDHRAAAARDRATAKRLASNNEPVD
jgi:hypothetical protein